MKAHTSDRRTGERELVIERKRSRWRKPPDNLSSPNTSSDPHGRKIMIL